jgi:competence protein ComEC
MVIIYLALAWFLGLWLGSVSQQPAGLWLGFSALSLAAAFLFRRHGRPAAGLALLGVLGLGALRYALDRPPSGAGQLVYYNGAASATLTGLVVREPRVRDSYQELRVRAEILALEEQSPGAVAGLALVRIPRYPAVTYGDRLELVGDLTPPEAEGRPGASFDYGSYLARQGIQAVLAFPQSQVLDQGQGSVFFHAIYALKERARAVIYRQLPDPQASLLSGILLGDDSGLPSGLQDQFRASGLTHIIAISGFNIAILAGVLLALGRPLLSRRTGAILALIGLALYTILVGAEASVVRAAIMGALLIVAVRLLGRPTFAPAGLFTAGMVMTLADPDILWHVGFQLSFMATLGLMLYVEPVSAWLRGRLARLTTPERARQLTGVLAEIMLATLAAQFLVLPLLVGHFEELSLISLPANLLVLPAQPGVMIWGGLATVSGLLWPALGQALAWVAWLFLTWSITWVRFFGSLPYAAVPLRLPLPALTAAYALILSLTWLARLPAEKRSQSLARLRGRLSAYGVVAGASVVTVLLLAWVSSRPSGRLHVHFLDVGQGDATFITTPGGRQILIDGGAYPSVLGERLGDRMPFWDRSLDLVVASHPDADHVAGLPGLFDRYRVGRLLTNGQRAESGAFQSLLVAAARSGTAVQAATAGTILVVDGVRLEILHPPPEFTLSAGAEHDNERSLGLRLVYGDFSLLLTGDAEAAAERAMLGSGRDLSALVYQAGHHGANTSSSAAFLGAVQPQVVVVSVGAENRFGHPHPEALRRVERAGASLLRTDELGSIEVISDGSRLWWQARP